MDIRSLKRLRKTTLATLLSSLVLPMAAHAFSPFVVQDIRITGLRSAEPGMVFSYIPARVGKTFDQEMATDSVRRLYATGLFNDVKITTEGRVVNITVNERPIISSVLFEGMNAFKSEDIVKSLADLGLGEGRALDPALLDRATKEIRNQYVSKGNYSVDVNHVLTPLPNNRVGISFQIKEGKLARIEEINFVGNEAFSSSTLEDQMDLTTPGFMTWYTGTDKFSREKLDSDIEKIRDYYMERGYLDVKVDDPQVTISPNLEDIGINITLHEGEKYTIRDLKMAGDLLGMGDELKGLIDTKQGETFNVMKIRSSAEAIKQRLGELGYALAEVNPVPQPVTGTQDVDVVFYVNPGKRIYVRQINIGGNTRTRDQVIRREMRQSEAAWYDATRVSTSRERIDRLGYFNDVTLTQAPVQGVDDQVDINVDVKEKPTGMINLGVGYGSTDKLSFQAGISQDNVFGSGTDLALSFSTSKYNRNVVMTHTDPYWTTSGISKTTTAYYRLDKPYSTSVNQDDDTYQVRAVGFGMNFGVPISEYDRVFLGATVEQNKIRLPAEGSGQIIPQAYREFVNNYKDKNTAVIFNIGWTKDTRDSAVAPTSGYLTSLNASMSVGHLKYYMLSAQQQYYLPLNKDYTLAFNVSADWGHTYGTKKPFPVIKNLYAGGIGSVRGYEGSSLGPRDAVSGDYLGGNTRLLANVQLFLPFPGTQNDRSLRWFLFADAGKVGVNGGQQCTNGSSQYGGLVTDPCGWRYSAGIGLSWNSPLGPLQISYAKPIKSKPGDNKQQFQFQIGTSF
ncbi:outer membrane protein assembly factor BamA [Pelistega europaea]|uniref:Outer membrane protein assembly factor BamA n=1 Tax=Pelistega europaea TaxID=106147 RepID=A0A7Y4P4R6_9BURK|nr:outer membrane protein assembly factor BamA [Pelistega europaea]NOL48973.1 outer membrane protein assembly factor BamA [Pelistega europaea]